MPSAFRRRLLSIFIISLFLGWTGPDILAQLPAASFHQLKRDIDLFSSNYFTVTEDPYGFIWFGSFDGGGLYRYDGYNIKSFYPDPSSMKASIASSRISEVYFGADSLLYVGTYFGFSTLDPWTGKIESFNNRTDLFSDFRIAFVVSYHNDTLNDIMWVGTAFGLAKFTPGDSSSFTMIKPGPAVPGEPKPEKIYQIVPDKRSVDLLWLGTTEGLFKYDISRDEFTLFKCPFLGDTIMSIADLAIDEKGQLWMSTADGKVAGFDPVTNKWRLQYLPSSPTIPGARKVVYKILTAGDDEAWISTHTGVGKINLSNGLFELWEYDASRPDGLLQKGVYRDMVADRHGRLWIASNYGIQYARQSFLKPSKTVSAPAVSIISVDAVPTYEDHKKPLQFRGNLSLQKDQREITFQYVLPNPLDPTSVTYQYMLQGYDNDWITTDQRTVRYPRLKGGTYTFLVKARERDDQSWTKTTSLGLSIEKRINEYWWFWLVVITGMLGLAFGLYHLLISRAKKAERLKADFDHQVSEIQMQALRAQMNPHFLFNSLNSIKYFAISKSKDETAAYLSKFSLLVRSILNNSKARTISLKDELDALQLYIEIEHIRLDARFDYLIDIDSSIHVRQAQIPPMILQPFVENAIWHGLMHKEGKGKLIVQVKDMGNQIQCIIEDNGIGREKAKTYRNTKTDHKESLGMQITSDRIALINKIYHIDTQVHVIDLADEQGNPSGTRVVINVPLIGNEEE